MYQTDLEEPAVDICSFGGDLEINGDIHRCERDSRTISSGPVNGGINLKVEEPERSYVLQDATCTLFNEERDVYVQCRGEEGNEFFEEVGQLPPDGRVDPERWFGVVTSELPWARTVTESRPGPGRGEKITRFD